MHSRQLTKINHTKTLDTQLEGWKSTAHLVQYSLRYMDLDPNPHKPVSDVNPKGTARIVTELPEKFPAIATSQLKTAL